MSIHDHPNGASPGLDDGAAVFRTKAEKETVSNPEKVQLVYSNSSLVQPKEGQLVYPESSGVQLPEPTLEPLRKHGVPLSELNTELTSNGNAQQFYGSAESKLHSKSLVNLRSPPDALPETGEGGKKRIMKLPLRRVVSSGGRRRRSRSEGTTPPKDQASSDESISPLMVQQLKDRLISIQKELQSLQQEKREESEEKGKFKALYDDEKRRNEEVEKVTLSSYI